MALVRAAAAVTATPLQVEVLGWPLALLVAMAVVAFAGGVLGTSIGSLPAFVMTGVAVVAGEAARLASLAAGGPGALGVIGITPEVAFGAFFGPHVGFAGALAGSAYAAREEYMGEGYGGNWAYHDAKNILIAFGARRVDVLLVGGAFGLAGFLIWVVSAGLALPWDPVAVAVVGSALLHRLVFGYAIVGEVRGEGLLDASPFAREATHETDGRAGRPAERLDVEVWQPWFYEWRGVALVGLAGGVLGGFTFWATGSPFLAFGLSAVTLVFLSLSIEDDYGSIQVEVPATHHVTLPASTAPMAYAGLGVAGATPAAAQASVPLPVAVLLGAAFGLAGALLGELFDRLFYMHADTHWDPPATSIVVTTAAIAVLSLVGVFQSAGWIPTPW